jgi:hypothetical protein
LTSFRLRAYICTEADNDSTNILAQRFNTLKSWHLRKVGISQLKSNYPGGPKVLLALFLRGRDIIKAFGIVRPTGESDDAESQLRTKK